MTDRIAEESIETVTGIEVMTEAGTGLEKDHFPKAIVAIQIGVQDNRSRSGSRVSTNRDRIRYSKCREYDHYAKDCPTSREEK